MVFRKPTSGCVCVFMCVFVRVCEDSSRTGPPSKQVQGCDLDTGRGIYVDHVGVPVYGSHWDDNNM